jgi:8-oxo-dGTP pyrophosphatase MutT (NUDIX family)
VQPAGHPRVDPLRAPSARLTKYDCHKSVIIVRGQNATRSEPPDLPSPDDACRSLRASVAFGGKVVTPQSAAIPYRLGERGELLILLVTSRRTRRWIIPKGKVRPRTLPRRSAEREAFEEAGVLGRIATRAIGTYWQGDALPSGPEGSILVQAFALEVTDELPVWDEMHLRKRRWFEIGDALRAVRDLELRTLLREFERHYRAASDPR